MHSTKKIGLALLCLLMACEVSVMTLCGIWNQYNPATIIGSNIQTESTDVKKVAEQRFAEFFKQYEGPLVPFEFRTRDKRVKTIEVLNREEDFVQFDYESRPASDNLHVTSYYTAALQENGWYVAQVVLQLEKTSDGYTIRNKMSPVQYQIQTDPSLHKPPATHYITTDRKETYVFSQSQLYVTYDAGRSSTEVPIPYEDIVGTNGSTYNELLLAHGYIVNRDFTTFVCYDETGGYLQYNEDMGKTWGKSRIISRTYCEGALYLSKAGNSHHITLVTDYSLGRECYSTSRSSDLKTRKQLFGRVLGEKRDIIFLSNETAYIGAGTDGQGNLLVYYVEDDRSTYTTLTIPAYKAEILGSSFKPFIQVEYVYQKRGITCVIVAQGTDGDYMKNNALVKGRYKSRDNISFTSDKEISDSSTLTGQIGGPI